MDTPAAPQQFHVVHAAFGTLRGSHAGLVGRLADMKIEYTDLFSQYAIAQQLGVDYRHATGFLGRVYRLWETAYAAATAPDREVRRAATNIRYGTELILGRAEPDMISITSQNILHS